MRRPDANRSSPDLLRRHELDHEQANVVLRSVRSRDGSRASLTREAPPMVYALCRSPVLGAGTYKVQFGETHAAFAVPDDSSLDPCFDTDRD